jgi:transcriptional regulator with XRE-family HTH domain
MKENAMINSIRAVRRAKGLTLEDVAARCVPPTTAQTIGRLETGTRTLSLGWMNRIAAALGVDASELVQLPTDTQLTITALLSSDGAQAPTRVEAAATARATPDLLAVRVTGSIGDYRAGDEIWCRPLEGDWAAALNRDILVPRPAGRFIFARLLNVDGEKLHLLPLGAGQRQQVVVNPAWAAVAVRLIRAL